MLLRTDIALKVTVQQVIAYRPTWNHILDQIGEQALAGKSDEVRHALEKFAHAANKGRDAEVLSNSLLSIFTSENFADPQAVSVFFEQNARNYLALEWTYGVVKRAQHANQELVSVQTRHYQIFESEYDAHVLRGGSPSEWTPDGDVDGVGK